MSYHVDDLRIDGLGDDALVVVLGYELEHLVEGAALHLLPFEVGERVDDEVEQDAALAQLLDEEVLAVGRGGVCTKNGIGPAKFLTNFVLDKMYLLTGMSK